MTRLGFLIARTLRHEAPLAALSVPFSDLLAELAGKSVALVGNARSLSGQGYGAQIDAADLVIRINRAPMPSPASHGTRTDWLALATALGPADRARLHPHRFLWMSPKRKRLRFDIATSPGFYLHPQAEIAALGARLPAPPTTGLMMIDMLARSEVSVLRLFGFDFFASLSLSGRRSAEQVPHDFNAEAAHVAALMQRDSRITRAE
ncbi:MAG: glycosyltransferase family 29 protein [Paracoccaceae bacterium]